MSLGKYYNQILRILTFISTAKLSKLMSSNGAAVINYHGVTERDLQSIDSPGLHIHISIFEKQMEYLSRNCSVIGLDELMEIKKKGSVFPPNAVSITFDDGYSNVVRCALPVLRKYRFQACMFVTAGYIDTYNIQWIDIINRAARLLPSDVSLNFTGMPSWFNKDTWRKSGVKLKLIDTRIREDFIQQLSQIIGNNDPGESRIVNSKEIEKWIDSGMSIGSHTLNHPILLNLEHDRLKMELGSSKDILEGIIARPVCYLAYPNGDYNSNTKLVADSVGYSAGFTLFRDHVSTQSENMALPRYAAGNSVERLHGAICGIEARLALFARRLGVKNAQRWDGTGDEPGTTKRR